MSNRSSQNSSEYDKNMAKRVKSVMHRRDSIVEKSKLFISELSNDNVFNLIRLISNYNLKLTEMEKTAERIEQQSKHTSNDIDKLENNIDKLELELEQIRNADRNQTETNNNDDDEMIVFLDSETSAKISHKVRFSNNIVRWLRGPLKSMVHGTIAAVDRAAQNTQINENVLHAVDKGLEKQKQQSKNTIVQPTFAEITSDWKIEGENPDRGYSSPSIWMRDPQDQRVLVKIQEHPICAANEWLAYALGKAIGLPVNQVQIALYENNLATVHVDVASEDEKTITFMDLPKDKRDALMTNPIMVYIDIFDFFIQNVDRNQQNILITIPKSVDINDPNLNKLKIHLIDHASSFGMGKLNAISLVAAKFHSKHLAVAKFDPIQKSKEFEQYLKKLPVKDRPSVKILDRFASITDDQIDSWITEIQDLLSSSQYNRIYTVLRRQRDIAKCYANEWGISSSSSNDSQDRLSTSSNVTLSMNNN